ncbi:MAG: protein-methionine-sulfoxide reductase catalytic subunit MsrP [Methylomonas sp.]|jgi:sulfoxide reductase catalytic subunit YedY|uniref:protein-methionine-sulfoxide reductase catalytic subunit MsrP n=1 Tax=Methylomonas sp. TaxID=418 RepID=UPI0025F90230|nr:protein-methionine-sulfoxide reductase catalytic subunit MsrP [Methylomonas sp.]MCK9605841.1 protein-methionine-sulfoxide reductase catalytic subunit MsrP [Methylomonas sp.]
MIIKTNKAIPASEITDPLVFQQRRNIIKALLAGTLLPAAIGSVSANTVPQLRWPALTKSKHSTDIGLITPPELVKNYTNYYEFSFNKQDSTELAQSLHTDNWTIEISGEVEKPGHYQLEDILGRQTLQEYVYRFRCVEAWSMVIPWIGFPLVDLIKRLKPLSKAKFVKFTSIYDPENMPKQRINAMLDWPYVEALRIDEAVHPLTILAVGMYGDALPKQNGAALRLVVPWKYGFKSIKAIVKIELLNRAPMTTWHAFAPNEYGFYANVNPSVPHPRWSQFSERRLGSRFFTPRRQTELYNGYGEQVASLYSDMDLRHFY